MTVDMGDLLTNLSESKIQMQMLKRDLKLIVERYEEATGFQVDKINRTNDNKHFIIYINEEKGDYGKYKDT